MELSNLNIKKLKHLVFAQLDDISNSFYNFRIIDNSTLDD